MQWILPVAFVVLPFMFLSPGLIHRGHHYAFLLTGLILAASWLYSGQKVQVKSKPLGLFGLYFCAWAVVVFLGSTSSKGVPYIQGWPYSANFPQIAATFMAIFIFTAAGVIFMSAASSKLKPETFYNFICAAVLIQATVALMQTFGFDPVYWLLSNNLTAIEPGVIAREIPIGTLGNQDFFFAYIAISIPLFFRKHWLFMLLVFIPLLFKSHVSTAVISALIGTSAFFWKGRSFAVSAAITGFAATLGFAYLLLVDTNSLSVKTKPSITVESSDKPAPDGSDKPAPDGSDKPAPDGSRVSRYMTAIKQINTAPKFLFGLGPGSKWGGEGSLHNEWLSTLHTFGLSGFLLAALFVFQTIKGQYRQNRILTACLVAASVNMLGNPALQFAPTLFLILILFGLAQRDLAHG